MAGASEAGGNANQGSGHFPPDGTGGFIQFQDDNTLYNVYDAGNFLTGKAFGMVGFSLAEVKQGAQINSVVTGNKLDTKADQKALENGYKYEGVIWKK